MKIIFGGVAFLVVGVISAWTMTTIDMSPRYQHAPMRPPAVLPVDWEAWHADRSAKLKDRISRTHYLPEGRAPNPSPIDGEVYIAAFENREYPYIENLPISEYRKVTQHFLDKFPVEDLNSRLAYEDRKGLLAKHSRKHSYWKSSIVRQLHSQWNKEYYESSWPFYDKEEPPPPEVPWTRRGRQQRAIEVLHRDRLEAFATQDSFGFARIPDISLEDLYVYTPDEAECMERPIPKAQPSADFQSIMAESTRGGFAKSMHMSNYHAFAYDDAYVPEFRQARGHRPHAVRGEIYPYEPEFKGRRVWHMLSLELVSLLKHDVPKVYVSKQFPDMKNLSSTAVRDLDDFESSAIEKLFDGQFLVVDESTERMQVLGAVHAGTTCIECHAVKQGELLGAFSYKLSPLIRPRLADDE